jgi:hypothetical protein
VCFGCLVFVIVRLLLLEEVERGHHDPKCATGEQQSVKQVKAGGRGYPFLPYRSPACRCEQRHIPGKHGIIEHG